VNQGKWKLTRLRDQLLGCLERRGQVGEGGHHHSHAQQHGPGGAAAGAVDGVQPDGAQVASRGDQLRLAHQEGVVHPLDVRQQCALLQTVDGISHLVMGSGPVPRRRVYHLDVHQQRLLRKACEGRLPPRAGAGAGAGAGGDMDLARTQTDMSLHRRQK